MPNQTVYIVSAVRTPIGSFGGQFSTLSAPQLGAAAIKGALEEAGVKPEHVDEVLMGNVVSANVGQAPARQAAIHAGIPNSVPCTTVNKVCSSGMKTVMFAAQSIALGHNDVVVAGGMESMSNIPFYVPDARWGAKFGDRKLVDGLTKDGLIDAYDQNAMGVCADATAVKYDISREQQDAYAVESYQRAKRATEDGTFRREIVAVTVPQRRGDDLVIDEDEEYKNVKFDKIPSLRPAFGKEGTVTAANASTINDGAAALVLVSEAKMKELGLKPIAKIVAFADAAQEPKWFTTAPTLAAPKALKRAGLKMSDMDFLEVNEAFAVVPMAFTQELGLDGKNMNVNGGGVSLGHPLGTSGARILVTLINVLHSNEGKYGLATLCNGGGGASAVVVEAV
ncbi:acetyl-CoA C-acyltransferase [Neolewinella antarctica]|uniref:acetyl-CoA C-acetyltransferase n=1 Tax=Neolewinella antarctica TaxID=442734 RepID=A0ABX0XAR6_9BACT|nr:acetyl-CoA C-acyltransferase [Neolewinella antarctica]NJC26038.1 acetyl-CoA C-acetyltransferase [Neolewinella antarctica]